MSKENIILDKSYAFSLRIVKLFQFITKEKKEYILSKQILRSGTSIGANVEEAIGGISKKDFRHKMSISYKEARETKYWLRLLTDSGYLKEEYSKPILEDCEELLKILFRIVKNSKE